MQNHILQEDLVLGLFSSSNSKSDGNRKVGIGRIRHSSSRFIFISSGQKLLSCTQCNSVSAFLITVGHHELYIFSCLSLLQYN